MSQLVFQHHYTQRRHYENLLIQTNIDYGGFWNTSDVIYYTFRCYVWANDVKSIRYRDADCWCPQHPPHPPPRNLWSASTSWCRYWVPLWFWSPIQERPLATRSPSRWLAAVMAAPCSSWFRSRPAPCPASASAEEIEEFNCRSLAEGPEEWNSDWNLKT